ncbi:phosphate ABC transporter permease subunit PstC [uncultured Jatrophihabitans sp.]|uniref:phosphate ABC transporter permease subunit PstC n=1 Tax=uncultured Jatrophihabitans sp. TaxID=1610747 RepID=UPI0035CBD28B
MAGGLEDAPPVFGAGDTGGKRRIGDRVFAGMSVGASGFVIVLVGLVGAFLLIKSVPSIADDKVNFLTSTEWSPTPGNLRFGIAALLYVTVVISLVAMIIAVPVAIGVALFITQYAPHSIRKPVAYILDLLAAIPSIVYGIWGLIVLAPKLTPVQNFLSHIPIGLFDNKSATKTIFDGGVVLAVMILPIITAISRDVFDRTPRANIEAALALGATKWEMIRMSVLPYGRAGVVSGSMLGLGRALGETIAVYLIVGTSSSFSTSIFSGGSTFASQIANGSSEFNNPESTGAYIAAGLVLFILTFIVNSAARAIVNRRKDFV